VRLDRSDAAGGGRADTVTVAVKADNVEFMD
jgi:hypothetical protein